MARKVYALFFGALKLSCLSNTCWLGVILNYKINIGKDFSTRKETSNTLMTFKQVNISYRQCKKVNGTILLRGSSSDKDENWLLQLNTWIPNH